MLYQTTFSSPLGLLILRSDGTSLTYIGFKKQENCTGNDALPFFIRAKEQLTAYFNGGLKSFDLPLNPVGTPFQHKVWQHLRTIPYGQTQSYGSVAHILETGPRAVGNACGKNPLLIITPCHRVLGQNKSLGGFSTPQGLDDKRFLLDLESH